MSFHNVAMSRIQGSPFEKILLGNLINCGGSIVSIQSKFWIVMAWYLFFLWGLATVFTLLFVKLM